MIFISEVFLHKWQNNNNQKQTTYVFLAKEIIIGLTPWRKCYCARKSKVHFYKNHYRYSKINSDFERSISWKGKYSEEIEFWSIKLNPDNPKPFWSILNCGHLPQSIAVFSLHYVQVLEMIYFFNQKVPCKKFNTIFFLLLCDEPP